MGRNPTSETFQDRCEEQPKDETKAEKLQTELEAGRRT